MDSPLVRLETSPQKTAECWLLVLSTSSEGEALQQPASWSEGSFFGGATASSSLTSVTATSSGRGSSSVLGVAVLLSVASSQDEDELDE